MEARILDAMRTCKKEIEDRTLRGRCISRVNEMRTIVEKYQRTLRLHPHNFCLRMEEVCRIPDIRKVIIGGTDEEFSACVEEVTSGLPKLTSQILEERTAKISALLPANDRRGDALSLATAWFNCGFCHPNRIHGSDTLMHQCTFPICGFPSGQSISETTFDSFVPERGWRDETRFTFSEVASNIVRGLILDCGEDPESITLAGMNSKLHRFAFYKNDELVVHNWEGTVSSADFVDVHRCGTNYAPRPVQFNYKHYNPSAYHRFLKPGEFPEFVHDSGAYDGMSSWGCLHCWRHGNQIFRISNYATLPTVKQHITEKRVLSKLCTMYIR